MILLFALCYVNDMNFNEYFNLKIRDRMDEINKYGVCTICTTYNQSAFIEDTMNGFCMQQTTVNKKDTKNKKKLCKIYSV